jgi:hypothetical protein
MKKFFQLEEEGEEHLQALCLELDVPSHFSVKEVVRLAQKNSMVAMLKILNHAQRETAESSSLTFSGNLSQFQ